MTPDVVLATPALPPGRFGVFRRASDGAAVLAVGHGTTVEALAEIQAMIADVPLAELLLTQHAGRFEDGVDAAVRRQRAEGFEAPRAGPWWQDALEGVSASVAAQWGSPEPIESGFYLPATGGGL